MALDHGEQHGKMRFSRMSFEDTIFADYWEIAYLANNRVFTCVCTSHPATLSLESRWAVQKRASLSRHISWIHCNDRKLVSRIIRCDESTATGRKRWLWADRASENRLCGGVTEQLVSTERRSCYACIRYAMWCILYWWEWQANCFIFSSEALGGYGFNRTDKFDWTRCIHVISGMSWRKVRKYIYAKYLRLELTGNRDLDPTVVESLIAAWESFDQIIPHELWMMTANAIKDPVIPKWVVNENTMLANLFAHIKLENILWRTQLKMYFLYSAATSESSVLNDCYEPGCMWGIQNHLQTYNQSSLSDHCRLGLELHANMC